MKTLPLIVAVLLIAITARGAGEAAPAAPTTPQPAVLQDTPPLPLPAGVQVLFSPADNIEDYLVKLIDSARVEILINQYAISSPKIIRALINAYAPPRQVFIAILLEAQPNLRNYQGPLVLRNNHLPCRVINLPNGFSNQRYCIIDRTAVGIGSSDWSAVGLHNNAETLFVVAEPSIATTYYRHFLRDLGKSKPADSADNQPAAKK